MARPRKGQLIRRKSGWRARITIEIDGETIQRVFDLGTTDKVVARKKMARLIAEAGEAMPEPEQASAPLTTADFAADWLKARERRAPTTADDERRWWDLYWADAIGAMPLGEVKTRDIRAALEQAAECGAKGQPLSRASVHHMRGVMLRMFDSAWRDELIADNPVARVKTSDVVEEGEKRERAIPTDAELRVFLASPHPSIEIKMLVLLSRTIGGQRAGDLNALDWSDFGPDFATCRVPRRKTRKKRGTQTLDVPEVVRPFIAAWHDGQGEPTSGPVFPVRRGKRAGERKTAKSSNGYAKRLRRDLKRALGVAFKGPGGRWTEKPVADYTPRERELFIPTDNTLPVDFHSMRRAFSTALARANVNVQTAGILTGHSDPRVHQRYVNAAQIRALPEAAVPKLEGVYASSVRKLSGHREGTNEKSPRSRGLRSGPERDRTADLLTARAPEGDSATSIQVLTAQNEAVTLSEPACDVQKQRPCLNSVRKLTWSTRAIVAAIELAAAALALPEGAPLPRVA